MDINLKTITDEGKREFNDFIFKLEKEMPPVAEASDDDIEIWLEKCRAFLDAYAEKVATEVYKNARHTARMAAHCQGCEEFTDKKMEAAFQTFLGKV